jgi:predicted ATPase
MGYYHPEREFAKREARPQMDGAKLIERIRLKNILSFGGEGQEIALEPLNVLIGPNGAGKSNLIDVLSLLQAAPRNLPAPTRERGGIREWLWKGAKETPIAELGVDLASPAGPLRYQLDFGMRQDRFAVIAEAVEAAPNGSGCGADGTIYRFLSGEDFLASRDDNGALAGGANGHLQQRTLAEGSVRAESVLALFRDPIRYPELAFLTTQFSRLRFYREWNLGRAAPPRLPQPTDLPSDFLLEDASNLGLVVNSIEHYGDTKERLLQQFRRFYEGATDLTTRVQGGTLQLFLHEEGLAHPISSARFSDGTLRFLCLLAILIHPEPPPLICIEEPELNLHPDIIPLVAELLVDAAQRTQLIVTTHSDTLVSAMSDYPEAVVVCERDIAGTRLRRLEPEKLRHWLNDYALGTVWSMGALGGTRW